MAAFGLFRHGGMDANQPALDVRNLASGYPGKRQAISNISFSTGGGERVAVIGHNGAGKSTLFKAVVGLLPITAGQILIYGADCHSYHSHIGYVPQQNAIDWSFPVSIFDVVMMGRSRHIGWLRRPGKKDRKTVQTILEQLSLHDLANRQISELSDGQRHRVFIARALAQETPILLLDEPFTGLDHHSEHEIIETLDILTQSGITILLSTHHLEKAALHFDSILILNQGSLLAYGKPDDVLKPQNLKATFGTAMPVFGYDGSLMFEHYAERGGDDELD